MDCPKLSTIANIQAKKISVIKNNNRKVGNNILTNRLQISNNRILLTDLNHSIAMFKVIQKKLILQKTLNGR